MRTAAATKWLRNTPSSPSTGDNLWHELAEQTAARARLAQTAWAHHAEIAARPPASPDDEQCDTEYRCEDCDKVLEGDDLNFDDDGITLCKFHYEYLLAETAAMSDEDTPKCTRTCSAGLKPTKAGDRRHPHETNRPRLPPLRRTVSPDARRTGRPAMQPRQRCRTPPPENDNLT